MVESCVSKWLLQPLSQSWQQVNRKMWRLLCDARDRSKYFCSYYKIFLMMQARGTRHEAVLRPVWCLITKRIPDSAWHHAMAGRMSAAVNNVTQPINDCRCCWTRHASIFMVTAARSGDSGGLTEVDIVTSFYAILPYFAVIRYWSSLGEEGGRKTALCCASPALHGASPWCSSDSQWSFLTMRLLICRRAAVHSTQ